MPAYLPPLCRPARPGALALLGALLTACASHAPQLQPQPPGPPRWQNEWARGAVFYEVFVRSYADSNGDGVGDLKGLISKLDYLQALGVEGLWLMPTFESPSYHGYDVVDYEAVDAEYGTLEDFSLLVQEAHRRGIRVLLDFMLNHTSVEHPWFVESAASPDSPRRAWYVWRTDNPGWTAPWGSAPTWHAHGAGYYYGLFWSGMPDLNYRHPEVRTEVKRLASLWLARGVDGFRLDAARHLVETGPGPLQSDTPETHAFWKELSQHVRSTRPEALLVGEVWSDTRDIAPYYGATEQVPGGDELPMTFNFPLAGAMLHAVKSGEAAPVVEVLEQVQATYPAGTMDGLFLTNHDNVRVATVLDQDAQRLRSAVALLLTLPGSPFLYYGEEIGLPNGPTREGDPAKRRPMPWNGSEQGGFTTGTPWAPLTEGWAEANVAAALERPDSLLQRYRRLIHLRRSTPALRLGQLQVLPMGPEAPSVLAFLREQGGERVLVAHNLSGSEVSVRHPLPGAPAEPLFADPGVQAAAEAPGAWRLQLPAHATGIWPLR